MVDEVETSVVATAYNKSRLPTWWNDGLMTADDRLRKFIGHEKYVTANGGRLYKNITVLT